MEITRDSLINRVRYIRNIGFDVIGVALNHDDALNVIVWRSAPRDDLKGGDPAKAILICTLRASWGVQPSVQVDPPIDIWGVSASREPSEVVLRAGPLKDIGTINARVRLEAMTNGVEASGLKSTGIILNRPDGANLAACLTPPSLEAFGMAMALHEALALPDLTQAVSTNFKFNGVPLWLAGTEDRPSQMMVEL